MSESRAWPDQPLVEPLTARELEILSLMAEHLKNREIADTLILSLNTVKWYARQIYGKLGASGRREAVSRARDLGLLGDAPVVSEPPLKLPAQLTPFLGRQEEIDRICRLLSGPAARLLTVVGPGGMGKTRLAIEVAACLHTAQAGPFQDGIFFVPLARLHDPSELASAIAQAIGFQFYQADLSLDRQLVQYLRGKQRLLVLDNFEHLIGPDSIRLLATLLTEAPGIKVLVTSRSRLHAYGEHVFPLAGLRVPEEGEAARWAHPAQEAEAYSGLQLFMYSARRLMAGFAMNAENLPHIVSICSLVGGLPLGIELAAGWIAILEPQQIAVEIKQSLDILATEAGAVPERHQSLRGVFDSSWRLLADQEREAFAALAVFEGGFDLKAAQHICRLSLQTLLALVNKSWVEQGTAGRFHFHDLLHRYGQEKLAAEPEREAAVRELHSRYYCDWLSAQEEDTWGPQQQTVLAAIEADIENVHAACLWAAQKGRVGRMYPTVDALGLFYYQGWGNYQAGQRIFRALNETLTAVEAWPAADRASVALLLARVLGWQSTFSSLLGDVQAVTRLLEEGSAVLDRHAPSERDSRQVRAQFALQRGYLLLYPDPEEARRHYARSLELYREVGDTWGTASALLGLGRALRQVGALEEAERTLTSSLSLHREMGDWHGESDTLATLGGVVMIQARFEEAEETIQRALSITPEADRFGTAFALGWLGTARMQAGRFAEAEAPLRECVARHRELGVWGYEFRWTFALVRVYLHQGRYDEARTLAERLVAEARDLNDTPGTILGLALLGEGALATGAFAEAERVLTQSAEAAGQYTKDRYKHGQAAMLGLAARGLGRPVEAAQRLSSALSRTRSVQWFPMQMVVLVGLSLLYADGGQAERDVELFSLASRYGFVANSLWFQDIVGQTLTAAAAGLSPGVLRAARERGAALDLEDTIRELLAGRPG
jgi:predicted ATPase/DNA-binding CsgD family transcriptional regulator